ncbi:hypothetical protein FQA39_LY04087 [Lamprigera yunnana]|nr:hypothetical protein FQA39_LY04087 [Lamprigera yunnana]
MASHLVVVDPSLPISSKSGLIDWSLCFICQNETREKLTNPERSTRKDKFAAYVSLESSLTRLNALNQLTSIPLRVDLSQLNDGTGIFNTLKSNKAVYHKSCRANCSENRIARAQKRSEQESSIKFSPKKTRQSSGTFDKNKSIFCATDTPSNQPLYRVRHKKVSASIVQHAKIFNDGKLVARSFKSTQDNKEDRPESLSEVQAYMNCSPVFKMSDLAKLYSSFMKDMGVDHIAHSSRLRDRLLNACSYLQSLVKIDQDEPR